MSQDHYDNQKELSSLVVAPEKLLQFQQWCEKNQVDSQVVMEKIIDACLRDEEIITSFFLTENNPYSLNNKIQFYLDKSLQELISRIEKLESHINQSLETVSPAKISPQLKVTKKSNQKDLDEQNITYLPRNEVWRRLKETDYVKYAGYDTFLKARSDEFIQYGIFYDSEKKRFYIVNEN